MNINMFLRKVLSRQVFREWRRFRISLRRMMREYWEFREKHQEQHLQFKDIRQSLWD